MTVYLGSRCTIMLNSYDIINDAFVKCGHAFSGRPQDLWVVKEITEGLGRKCCRLAKESANSSYSGGMCRGKWGTNQDFIKQIRLMYANCLIGCGGEPNQTK